MEDAGADALSLREVARAAGVSPTAVYRHFPDKRALMVAIAEAGVKRLARAQEDAANAATDLRCAFQATGRAYVLFALDNPELFRLIFTYPDIEGHDATKDAASFLLHDHALALAGGNVERGRGIALHAWSVVHGLAMLMLDGRLPRDPDLIDTTLTSGAMAT